MNGQKDFISPREEHQFIIEDQNHCCLCGTQLEFKYQVDYLTLQVREDADCPSCRIRMKTKEHGLH